MGGVVIAQGCTVSSALFGVLLWAPVAQAAQAPASKSKRKPVASELHVVHAQGDQLIRTNVRTGASVAVAAGKVVAAKQDGEGNWWLVRAQGKTRALVRMASNLELSTLKVLVPDLPSGPEHFVLQFSKDTALKLTALDAVREATKSCGGYSGAWLCDEAMDWKRRKTWTWNPTAAQRKTLGINVPKPALRTKVTEAPLRKPFSKAQCMCWQEPYPRCGNTTPLGKSGWTLMLTSVECGDLAHPGCVVESADKGFYGALGTQKVFSTKMSWTRRSRIHLTGGPDGSCGPFYITASGDWITDGSGIFCTMGKGSTCTAPVKGDYLGTAGAPMLRVQLH